MLKKIWGIVCIGLMLSTTLVAISAVAGEVRFVRPSIEVPVRRGQGTKYKILRLVKSGDQVELLEQGDSWARVLLKNGTEGWMPKRFLSSDAPPFKLVRILRTENEKLKQKNSALDRELTELRGLHANTGSELSSCIAQRDTIRDEYQKLRTDTADVVALQDEMAETKKEIQTVRAAFADVEQQNKDLKRKTAITWFLAGGGMILIGWIIGLITCRSKKRRPSLL